MTATQGQGRARGRRQRWLIVALVVAAIVALAALAVAWWFFFGQEAPAAPTIDDAVRVLLPSLPPE